MTAMMKAAVFVGANQPLRIEQIAMPKPREGEALIKVTACGVCHTDLHVLTGEVNFPTPAVLGHEISGHVVELGPGVKKARMGQPVVSSFIIPCGTCQYCSVGRDDMCEKFFSFNRLKGQMYDGETRLYRENGDPIWMYSMGGLAEYAVVPETDVFPVPESTAQGESAILGCAVFTAYGAVRHAADIRAGERVAVVAAGGVGQNIVQWAKAFGASQIIALDVADDKLELAKKMGATDVVNVRDRPVEQVKALTDGQGVDVAIEALGTAQTFSLAVDILKDGGRMIAVGIAPVGTTAQVDMQRLVRRGLRIAGSYGARVRADMPEIVRLAAQGFINYRQSITATYSLDDADQAYQDLKNRRIGGRAIVHMA